ncbi:hypothetical protein [Nocardia gipuzkoensis]|uniref:hypothetical protein n=1 Tax=Nocardia gipuzkoensis TaxID=2749991 RepID=UPI003EE10F1D
MSMPMIPQTTLIPHHEIPSDETYQGLKIVRYQTDPAARQAYDANQYEFQHELDKRHMIRGVTLALKGSDTDYRISATMHPSMRQFVEIVRYDPSADPRDDFNAQETRDAHEQTQQDFKGAKRDNLATFKQYIVEAIRGDRVAYLPTVSGWQPPSAFDDTIFVALDESIPRMLYGWLFLPKRPVLQSDGQTQTAALFQAFTTGNAENTGARDTFGTTLEIELNVPAFRAKQSFADRNGRGSKKNKNLVAQMDSSSALAQLRARAVEGTIFDGRLGDGRSGGATVTATKTIVDLSTMDQMLLAVISRSTAKPHYIKSFHVEHFEPYCREFLLLLEEMFGDKWVSTSRGSDSYRRLYVHGWPFVLKALATVYHDVRIDVLGPLSAPIGPSSSSKDDHTSKEEAHQAYLDATQQIESKPSSLTMEDFKERLRAIDWYRHRQHWIAITGAAVDKNTGRTKTRQIIDATGEKITVVEAKAQNTASVIADVVRKIEGQHWRDLTKHVNAAVDQQPTTDAN